MTGDTEMELQEQQGKCCAGMELEEQPWVGGTGVELGEQPRVGRAGVSITHAHWEATCALCLMPPAGHTEEFDSSGIRERRPGFAPGPGTPERRSWRFVFQRLRRLGSAQQAQTEPTNSKARGHNGD